MAAEFFWCLDHKAVERLEGRCAGDRVLGPYPSAEAASQALDRVSDRNRDWDAEDRAWEGEDDLEEPAP